MIVVGMDHFLSICKKKLVEWYNEAFDNMSVYIQEKIDLSQVYVVWSCKTLQNYKALLSTSVSGDGIYVEFTYNGDKQELYMDVYHKLVNQRLRRNNHEEAQQEDRHHGCHHHFQGLGLRSCALQGRQNHQQSDR